MVGGYLTIRRLACSFTDFSIKKIARTRIRLLSLYYFFTTVEYLTSVTFDNFELPLTTQVIVRHGKKADSFLSRLEENETNWKKNKQFITPLKCWWLPLPKMHYNKIPRLIRLNNVIVQQFRITLRIVLFMILGRSKTEISLSTCTM